MSSSLTWVTSDDNYVKTLGQHPPHATQIVKQASQDIVVVLPLRRTHNKILGRLNTISVVWGRDVVRSENRPGAPSPYHRKARRVDRFQVAQ